MRRILHCKRKSVPNVDVVEDGARALVTEEGLRGSLRSRPKLFDVREIALRGLRSAPHSSLDGCAV